MNPRSTNSCHATLGRRGEDAAEQWYRDRGWTILERNWSCREGELDVVAVRDGTVAVCEVKSRANTRFMDPALAIGPAKQARVRRATLQWLSQQPWRAHVRFDAAIVVSGQVRMIEDAF